MHTKMWGRYSGEQNGTLEGTFERQLVVLLYRLALLEKYFLGYCDPNTVLHMKQALIKEVKDHLAREILRNRRRAFRRWQPPTLELAKRRPTPSMQTCRRE